MKEKKKKHKKRVSLYSFAACNRQTCRDASNRRSPVGEATSPRCCSARRSFCSERSSQRPPSEGGGKRWRRRRRARADAGSPGRPETRTCGEKSGKSGLEDDVSKGAPKDCILLFGQQGLPRKNAKRLEMSNNQCGRDNNFKFYKLFFKKRFSFSESPEKIYGRS